MSDSFHSLSGKNKEQFLDSNDYGYYEHTTVHFRPSISCQIIYFDRADPVSKVKHEFKEEDNWLMNSSYSLCCNCTPATD